MPRKRRVTEQDCINGRHLVAAVIHDLTALNNIVPDQPLVIASLANMDQVDKALIQKQAMLGTTDPDGGVPPSTSEGMAS